MSEKRLVRKNEGKMVCGVATGIADYLNVDPVLVRLGFALLTFADGIGFALYVILCIVMPLEGTPAAGHSGNGHRREVVNEAPKVHPTDFEPLGSRDN